MEKVFQVIFFLTIIQASFDVGLALEIEVKPHHYDGLLLKAVNVTCTVKGIEDHAGDIVSLQILKEDKTHLVSLHRDSTVFTNKNLDTDVSAHGEITDDKRSSYLSATIYSVIGKYTCAVYYFDLAGFLQEETDSGHFDVGEQDVGDVFRFLMNHMLQLENRQNEMEHLVNKQLNILDTEVFENRISHIETVVNNQSIAIGDLVDKETYMSAFSAELTPASNSNYDKAGLVFVFGHVLLNIGNDYDPSTGIFTAPRKGLYVFHVAVRADNGNYVNLHLQANGKTVASVDTESKEKNDQSSASTLVQLEAGQIVKTVVDTSSPKPFDNHASAYSVFTGYIIKAL